MEYSPILAVAVAVAGAAATAAAGQSFNMDFGGHGVPSNVYGAGANQPGTWNQIVASSGALVTTTDEQSSVTYTNSMLDGSMTISGADAEDFALMGDYLYNTGGRTLHLAGLTGDYTFYLYGWAAPLDGPFGTGGTTPFKIAIPGGNTKQVTLDYFAPWPGMQVEGNSFVKVDVHIPSSASFIIISVDPPGLGYSIIQGMQIVPIPAPPAAALLLGAGVLSRRRR